MAEPAKEESRYAQLQRALGQLSTEQRGDLRAHLQYAQLSGLLDNGDIMADLLPPSEQYSFALNHCVKSLLAQEAKTGIVTPDNEIAEAIKTHYDMAVRFSERMDKISGMLSFGDMHAIDRELCKLDPKQIALPIARQHVEDITNPPPAPQRGPSIRPSKLYAAIWEMKVALVTEEITSRSKTPPGELLHALVNAAKAPELGIA